MLTPFVRQFLHHPISEAEGLRVRTHVSAGQIGSTCSRECIICACDWLCMLGLRKGPYCECDWGCVMNQSGGALSYD
jgi:hypothetical protein